MDAPAGEGEEVRLPFYTRHHAFPNFISRMAALYARWMRPSNEDMDLPSDDPRQTGRGGLERVGVAAQDDGVFAGRGSLRTRTSTWPETSQRQLDTVEFAGMEV